MVKNRFNSLLIKQRKLTPQFKKEEKLVILIKESLSENTTENSNVINEAPRNKAVSIDIKNEQMFTEKNKDKENRDKKGKVRRRNSIEMEN